MYIGFGAGVAPIFGYAHGEANRVQTKNIFTISGRLVVITSVLLVVLCMFFRNFVVTLFIDIESPSFELAQTGFTIFALGYFFAGMNIFSSIFFTSVSNGKISALISFCRTFLFIMGMLLILPPIFGTSGVWFAIPVAEILALIIAILLIKKYKNSYFN